MLSGQSRRAYNESEMCETSLTFFPQKKPILPYLTNTSHPLLKALIVVAQVTVIGKLKFTFTPPLKATVSESSNLLLDCAAKGNAEITWKRTGKVLPHNHVAYPNGTLLLRNVVPNNAGTYTCVAKNALR